MELLTRFRQLGEDQRRNEMIDVLKRQHKTEAELSEIDAALARLDDRQRALFATDTGIDIARYLHALDCGETIQEERRIQALKLDGINKLHRAKMRELASAWQDRRAAEKRHEREQTIEQRESAKRCQQNQLDDWLARTEESQ